MGPSPIADIFLAAGKCNSKTGACLCRSLAVQAMGLNSPPSDQRCLTGLSEARRHLSDSRPHRPKCLLLLCVSLLKTKSCTTSARTGHIIPAFYLTLLEPFVVSAGVHLKTLQVLCGQFLLTGCADQCNFLS